MTTEDLSTFGILFNNYYGGFGFSSQFYKEYRERMKISPGQQTYFDDDLLRTDSVAIQIFQEKGSEWCSDEYCRMAITWLPVYFKPYYEITEYDGLERVEISEAKFYKKLVLRYLETRLNPDHYFVEATEMYKTMLNRLR